MREPFGVVAALLFGSIVLHSLFTLTASLSKDATGHLPFSFVAVTAVVEILKLGVATLFTVGARCVRAARPASPRASSSTRYERIDGTPAPLHPLEGASAQDPRQDAVAPARTPLPPVSPSPRPQWMSPATPGHGDEQHWRCRLLPDADWRLLWPAMLYTVSNNVQYLVVERLRSAVIVQLISSTELLVVGALSVCLLRKRLSLVQWASLVLLCNGVVSAELASCPACSALAQFPLLPVALTLLGSSCAALAGILVEKYTRHLPRHASYFETVLPLYLLGSLTSSLAAVVKEPHLLSSRALSTLPPAAWLLVGMQTAIGIMAGLLIRSVGNIVKGFAGAASLFLTALLTVHLTQEPLSPPFILAMTNVGTAMVLYKAGALAPAPTRVASHSVAAMQEPGAVRALDASTGEVVVAVARAALSSADAPRMLTGEESEGGAAAAVPVGSDAPLHEDTQHKGTHHHHLCDAGRAWVQSKKAAALSTRVRADAREPRLPSSAARLVVELVVARGNPNSGELSGSPPTSDPAQTPSPTSSA